MSISQIDIYDNIETIEKCEQFRKSIHQISDQFMP